MHGRIALLALLILAAALGAAPALATKEDDFNAVYNDWKPDHDVTACKWTEQQLQNADDVAAQNPDFAYLTDFRDEVHREIARWRAGGCAGVSPVSVRNTSPLHGARITTVRGKGGAAGEYVKVKNTAKTTLSFRKATLRNRKHKKAVFPARFKLGKGKTAVVHVGCAKGKRHAYFKGTKVWLCRRSQFFRDKGDTAQLADAKGVIVSQRGYGTDARRVKY